MVRRCFGPTIHTGRKLDASKSVYTHMLGERYAINTDHSEVNLIFLYTQKVMVCTSHLYVFYYHLCSYVWVVFF